MNKELPDNYLKQRHSGDLTRLFKEPKSQKRNNRTRPHQQQEHISNQVFFSLEIGSQQRNN